MELHLLRHPQAVVEEVAEPVGALRPGLDRELHQTVRAIRPEPDLARLEVAVERREAEVGGRHLDHADGPVHGPGIRTTNSSPTRIRPSSPSVFWKLANSVGATQSDHAHSPDDLVGAEVGVADPHPVAAVERRSLAGAGALNVVELDIRRRRRRVLVPGARFLLPAHGRGTPHVAPGRETDPTGQRAAVARRREALSRDAMAGRLGGARAARASPRSARRSAARGPRTGHDARRSHAQPGRPSSP